MNEIFKKVAGMDEVGSASTDKLGGPNQSRTGDLSMPWTYDPNFTMGPFYKLQSSGF